MYQFDLTEQIEALKNFSNVSILKKNTPSSSAQQQERRQEETLQKTLPEEQTVDRREHHETVGSDHPETDSHPKPADTPNPVSDDVSVVPHTHVVRNVGQFVSRLPKLTLLPIVGTPSNFRHFGTPLKLPYTIARD